MSRATILAAAESALASAGIDNARVIVPPGEASKSIAVFDQVCEGLIAARIERSDLVIALGGGVIGDLAGFAASAVRRGLEYVQVPTTLLAQVDSSVGGKTGINSKQGKNLIGAFHQPILVLADTALLDTLPERLMRAGYAEVVKYGLLGDADFFSWLEANWQEIFSGGPAREHAIAVSCRMKASIVARDERETGERALVQFRAHFRPCARGGGRIFRPPASRRSHRHRHGAGLEAFGAAGAAAAGGRRPGDPSSSRRSGCRPRFPISPDESRTPTA